MNTWINEDVREEVRKVFEPRYNRSLSDTEIEEIAENLTGVTEQILKYKWRQHYEA